MQAAQWQIPALTSHRRTCSTSTPGPTAPPFKSTKPKQIQHSSTAWSTAQLLSFWTQSFEGNAYRLCSIFGQAKGKTWHKPLEISGPDIDGGNLDSKAETNSKIEEQADSNSQDRTNSRFKFIQLIRLLLWASWGVTGSKWIFASSKHG